MRFFLSETKKLKIWDFKGKFSNAKSKPKKADPPDSTPATNI